VLSLDHDGTDVSQLTMESGWHDFWFRMGFKSAIYFGVILFTRLNNFLAKLVNKLNHRHIYPEFILIGVSLYMISNFNILFIID